MNNINNSTNRENFTCDNLREIHMSYDPEVELSRERFDEIIAAAEADRARARRRRKMLRAAVYCLLVCALCSGLLIGMCTWEKATAGKDDETRIVQQGDNLIIGSGVVGSNETVGVTVEEYASIADIPEDIREKAHFIALESVDIKNIKISQWNDLWDINVHYLLNGKHKIITNERLFHDNHREEMPKGTYFLLKHENNMVYEQIQRTGTSYYICFNETLFRIYIAEETDLKIETLLFGLH